MTKLNLMSMGLQAFKFSLAGSEAPSSGGKMLKTLVQALVFTK